MVPPPPPPPLRSPKVDFYLRSPRVNGSGHSYRHLCQVIHCTDKDSSRCSSGTGRREQNKQNKYNYLLSNYIFIPLACEISGVWCVEGIDFLNELGRRTSLVTGDKIRMKHIISSKDCQLLYREVMQLASVVVSLLLTSAMINTPPSATPNYNHPQYLMPPGT